MLRTAVLITVALIASVATSPLVQAQAGRQGGIVYDVKVICAKAQGRLLAPGMYWTAINVLNPGRESVKLETRVAVALPGFTMGPVSAPVGAELRPNRALEIDCPTLRKMAEGVGDVLKGFAMIRSTGPLRIVAVYTQSDTEGKAVSIDVERVGPRPAAGCPDLIVQRIERPSWDAANHQSVIRAAIANIGSVDAPSTLARLIDPSTTQPTGAPYNDVVPTGPIPAGGVVTVAFHLPYWVYNPDADLEVTADYKGTLEECNERNNKAKFHELG